MQPDSGPGGDFYHFCDVLEVKNGVSAGPSGWGLDNALQAWGNYWKSSYYQQSKRSIDVLGASHELMNVSLRKRRCRVSGSRRRHAWWC